MKATRMTSIMTRKRPGAEPRHSDQGDAPRGDRPERSGRRRGRRGGKRRGRREWRDSDNRAAAQDGPAGEQDFNASHRRRTLAARTTNSAMQPPTRRAMTAISRAIPDEQQQQHRGQGPWRIRDVKGRGGRGGRSRGGRNRNRGGRGRNNNGSGRHDSERGGNREGNRAPRDEAGAPPQQRPQQNNTPRSEDKLSSNPKRRSLSRAPREPREAARPAPKSQEKKDYEKVNEAPE
jgi:hypothetical protein